MKKKDKELWRMKLKKILFVSLGSICLAFGTIGVFLPIIPTTPFYILTLFFFAKSSEKLNNWFVGTKLYKKHLESFVEKRGILPSTKRSIIATVTFLMALALFMMLRKGVWIPCVIIGLVWLAHVYYFCFHVRTIYEESEGEINDDKSLCSNGFRDFC